LIQRSKPCGNTKICIGHPGWLQHHENFQLSFEFCKSIIDLQPYLRSLELYNVQDCYQELKAYIADHMPTKMDEEDLILHNEI